ncbi:MAG: AraC family transcriptional regulator [Pseudomonadales bacterium]|nr:AraC family transcriptional regulator [Pseudomonadales bacterium]MCP5303082.1 AraC family transcriptional regulator [Pseudomonadales bacterium]
MTINLDSSALAQTPSFEINDPASISAYMSNAFRPNQSIVRGKSLPVAFRHNSLQFGTTTINLVRYGTAARVEAPPAKEIFLAMFTLAGKARVDQGDRQFIADSGTFCVLNPNRHLNIELSNDFEQLTIRIADDAVRRSLLQLSHRELKQPLEFAPVAYLINGQAASFARLVKTICEDMRNPLQGLAHPAVSKHLEEALVNLLLTEFNHNHSDKLESPLDRLTPYFLKRAQEYIHANLEQPISISEIATASGASVRSLQNAFKHYLNTTLTLYLRHQRLYKVRHALLSAAANGLSVTDIALAHGFTHLSKFSHYYKTLFGESPLQTKTGQR